MNRRRVRRRRRAIPARRPVAPPLFARLKAGSRAITARLCTAAIYLRARLAEWAGGFLSWRRRVGAIAGRHVRTTAILCRDIYNSCRACRVSALSLLSQDLAAIRRYLLARFTRIWTAANRELELPEIKLAPFFRVASALFAAISIGVAGFTAWQIIPGVHKADKPPAFVAARDHHPDPRDPLADKPPALVAARDHHPDPRNLFADKPPALVAASDHHPAPRDSFAGQPAPEAVVAPVDAEMQFVALAIGPEDEVAGPVGWESVLASDVDAQDWYDYTAGYSPEEYQVAALSRSPRPRKRPDNRQPSPRSPTISGIPIAPESPDAVVRTPPPWLANAVIPRHRGTGPMIAVVIDDAGVAQRRTARAMELPAPLTIAFIPYSDNLEKQTRAARSRGHELLLHIPMEPGGGDEDPGHNALLTSLHRDEIMRRFRWALDRFDGYVGVNNHMGSKFMARPDLVKPVLEEIHERGLLFLDSRTDHKTVGTSLAQSLGMPHATRNVFLDNDLDAEKIRSQLAELERVARARGHAIAIGHPHDVTTETLAEWIPEARARGFVLVPVSTIVKMEYEPRLASAAAGGEPDGLLGGAQ
jgi:polysaccharide deacetylase 2 family uncharacterized protein YibQ